MVPNELRQVVAVLAVEGGQEGQVGEESGQVGQESGQAGQESGQAGQIPMAAHRSAQAFTVQHYVSRGFVYPFPALTSTNHCLVTSRVRMSRHDPGFPRRRTVFGYCHAPPGRSTTVLRYLVYRPSLDIRRQC